MELSSAELRAAAQREQTRLEAIGEIDMADCRQPVKAPAFDDSLVGKYVEIRWRYYYQDDDGKRKQVYIWCEAARER